MKPKTLFSILATAALGIVMAGPAYAATFTWKSDAGSTDFRTESNWTKTGPGAQVYPIAGDRVIIQSTTNGNDPVIDDQDEAFGELDIKSGGKLTITGQTVTLDGTVQHDIDGELHLASDASNSVLKITGAVTIDITDEIVLQASNARLDLDADVTVQGAGQIKGEHNDAKIQIEGGDTLTSTMLIQGHMVIETNGGSGNGTFDNGSSGVVDANAAGTLNLADGLALSGSGTWQVTGTLNSKLQFNEAATGLTGPFVLNSSGASAELEINDDITTTGSFTNTDGTLDVNGAETCFIWATGQEGAGCS